MLCTLQTKGDHTVFWIPWRQWTIFLVCVHFSCRLRKGCHFNTKNSSFHIFIELEPIKGTQYQLVYSWMQTVGETQKERPKKLRVREGVETEKNRTEIWRSHQDLLPSKNSCTYSGSGECIALWTARVRAWQNPFPHREHLKGFSFKWMYLEEKVRLLCGHFEMSGKPFRVSPHFLPDFHQFIHSGIKFWNKLSHGAAKLLDAPIHTDKGNDLTHLWSLRWSCLRNALPHTSHG